MRIIRFLSDDNNIYLGEENKDFQNVANIVQGNIFDINTLKKTGKSRYIVKLLSPERTSSAAKTLKLAIDKNIDKINNITIHLFIFLFIMFFNVYFEMFKQYNISDIIKLCFICMNRWRKDNVVWWY